MTWTIRALYILAGVLAVGAAAFWMGKCSAPTPPSDYGPAVIDTVEVIKFLPDDSPSLGERLRYNNVEPQAGGEAPLDTTSPTDYATRAMLGRDTTLSAEVRDTLRPVYPLLRIETRAERGLKLGIERSDGVYVVRDYPSCRHPCRVDAQGDSILVREQRQIPGLGLAKHIATCAAVGGVAGGVAWLAGYSEPVAVGAVGGGSCVALKVLF